MQGYRPSERRRRSMIRRKEMPLWQELPLLLVVAFCLAVLIRTFLVQAFYIPSGSMEKTLLIKDRVLVNKVVYDLRDPVRGEIVVFRGTDNWAPEVTEPVSNSFAAKLGRTIGDLVGVSRPGERDFIKRVIGLPGDRLEVRGGVIVLNGVPVKRAPESPAMIPVDANVPCDQPEVARFRTVGPDGRLYCALPRFRETLPTGRSYDTIDLGYMPEIDDYPAVTIPPDHIFVMGDNRDESADSRVPAYRNGLDGPVPFENIGGRAEFITFSLDGTTKLWNPLTWFSALRGGRAGTSLHPVQEAR